MKALLMLPLFLILWSCGENQNIISGEPQTKVEALNLAKPIHQQN